MNEPVWSSTTIIPPSRDELAMAAMQGLLAYSHFSRPSEFTQDTARLAYRMADAMLAERAKGGTP